MEGIADRSDKYPVLPYIRESDYAARMPWYLPERRMLDYLLVFIKEGRCVFTVDGVKYEFHAGEFCLIQPGRLNELEGLTETVTPFAHLDFFYNPLREKCFPTRAGQTDLTPYRDLMQPDLSEAFALEVPVKLRFRDPVGKGELMLQMVEQWQKRDPLSQLKAQQMATDFVIAILEDHAEQQRPARESAQSLEWIPSYLIYHLGESLSIADMARRAHLSPSRFSAVFKEQFGKAPHQFFMDMRVNHAKELLVQSAFSQEEVASYCGFANIHHFSKTFRLRTGLSPGEWRRRGTQQTEEIRWDKL